MDCFCINRILLILNIRIVPQSQSFIIERLGGYFQSWEVGLHVKMPFVDRIANKVSLKERVLDFKPQPVITKDNVTMMIDTVIYFQITDPKLYTYGVENPMNAIENLSATTLRNIIGELELDGTLTSRDVINTRMRSILDEATDPWGIKVNRVEVKNIIPPESIQEAMEKQMQLGRLQVGHLGQHHAGQLLHLRQGHLAADPAEVIHVFDLRHQPQFGHLFRVGRSDDGQRGSRAHIGALGVAHGQRLHGGVKQLQESLRIAVPLTGFRNALH